MSFKSELQSNNTDLQAILDAVNALPDAGIDLPELTTPATEDEVFVNQEYIDANGAKKVGTFTIDEEISTQNSLISQIQNAVNALPDAGSGGSGGGASVETCTVKLQEGSQIWLNVAYTNGNMEYKYEEMGLIDGYVNVITNVACGTILYLSNPDEWLLGILVNGGSVITEGAENEVIIALDEVPDGGEVTLGW